MSKLTFSNTGVTTGQPVLASQVSQSFDAFTGAGDYAITISGSLTTAANSQVSLGGDLVLADNVSAISQSNFTASAGGGGNVILKYNESTKLATSATGVDMSGKFNMNANDISDAGTIVASNITASTSIRNEGNTFLGNANTDRVSITGSLEMTDPGSGDANVSMSIDNDEFKMIQGADGTFTIGTPQLNIKGNDQAETVAIFNQDGDCQLFFNNVRRIRTVSTGMEVTASSANTGIIVTDGTNNSTRSATATKFNFDGNTYVSNESTNGAAKVAFALGGTAAANAKVAVSASNDLHVYSGSINVQSGLSVPTGSYFSGGNLNANATQNAVGIQTADFIVSNVQVSSSPTIIFRYYPWLGLYPLPALNASNNFVVTMKANLLLMERGSTLVDEEDNVGYLEYSSVFGIRGAGYQLSEVTGGGTTIANKTSNVLTSGGGSFFVGQPIPGTDQGYLSLQITHGGVTPSNGLQVGGTVTITVAQQIA